MPVTQDLVEVLGAQHARQDGLRQEARGVVGVLHAGLGLGGVADPVVDDGIHRYGHRVPGQNLGGLLIIIDQSG